MQLHACLLLFIITTDKILALSHCGGHVSLEEPAGHMNLTLPGLYTDPPNADETPPVSVCTWLIGIPLGQKVLLTPVWLESGSNVSVRCVWNEERRLLESGGTVVLSHCDENKATLSWRGAGQSSNSIQLSYVREDERNSSEDHSSTAHSDVVPWPKTGTSLTSTAPVGQEVVTGTDWGRSRLPEGLKEGTSEPRSVSSSFSQGREPLHSTSLPQTRTVTEKADRETLPLPEEEPNNRAETSGAAHLTDGPVSADERTHPYFQHAFVTSTLFHTSQSTNTERFKFPHTQMPVKHATASSSSTDTPENTVTQTSTLSIATQGYPVASSSSISTFTSSLPELPSRVTWKSLTTLSPHDGAVSQAPGENLPHSWRSQRSTDVADLTSAVTSEPLKTQTVLQKGDTSNANTAPTSSSSSSSYWKNPSRIHSTTTHISDLNSAVEASSFHANLSETSSSPSGASDVTSQTSTLESSDQFENKEEFHTITFSTQSHTSSPHSTGLSTHSTLSYTTSTVTQTSQEETRSPTHSTQRHLVHTHTTTDTISSLPDFTEADEWILTDPPPTPSVPVTLGDVVQKSAATGTNTNTEPHTSGLTSTFLHEHSPTVSPAPAPHFPSTGSVHSSTPPYTSSVHTGFPTSPRVIHTSTPLPSATTEPAAHTPLIDHKTTPEPSATSSIKSTPSPTPHTQTNVPSPSPSSVPATRQKSKGVITTTHSSVTTAILDDEHKDDDHKSDPSQENRTTHTSSILTSVPSWRSTTSQMPKFYIVPDQPAAIRVESIELLLQIIMEESTSGLQDETAAWVEPYLQRAPGFSRLLGVWSSGHAVQSLVEFKTSEALQWLDKTGPASLLERTGLAQAVREGRSFRSSKITNITLGGLQADVCEWVLQCPAGHNCVSQPDASNYSCSSVCHFDYCHHHGICTHHPGQRPVCRCLVGEDFWYMGQRCDMRMTRARLVGACLAILLIIVTVIGVLAFLAVRRYRAILIQAKVDQTRSSYRRFNHFDELSGRFWLRSWAGSADSLDNPAFTRSDELLHLRALDRPCCYHDDTLSLASTCPSHGTRINTIYPHSSQYGWRGSEVSMGDGVLDSGKASDLSVCSWPVEPIHWTPFPLLQQLAAQRTPTVRVSRPRSYCEGMELVDLGKSWTA